MRPLRAALLLLSILLVSALLAAWLVPAQLDWSHYRGTIAQLAGSRLGLPVAIQGPVALTLLPEPLLTAGQVSVGDLAADGVLIRVKALRLRLALLPLLAGRIDARELVLRGPELHIPWPAQPDRLAQPPDWLSSFNARVEDGRLSIGQFTITGIDGTLSSVQSGTLTAAVAANIVSQRWNVSARLAARGSDGTARLEVTIRGEGRGAGTAASFSGQFSPQGQLAGSVKADGPDLSLLLPAPPLRFSAAGRLTVAGGLAEADELTLQLAGLPASGAVALRVLPYPRLDIALSATRLSLDPWISLLRTPPAHRLLLPVGLDVSADAATMAGATLRRLRATLELTAGEVAVKQVAAQLPGQADLRLSGRISSDAAGTSFVGDGSLRAPVLRGTLRWLLPDSATLLAELPADAAQRADLDGHVALRSGRIVLSRLHGTLDSSQVSGSLDWQAGTPPAIALDLRLDRLRLDGWLADAALRRAMVSRFNTDLRIGVRQAAFAGITLHDLTLDAATTDGTIRLRRLEGTGRAAHLLASGTLDKAAGLTGGSLTVTTGHAEQLADLLPAAWRATPAFWHGPARLNLSASGPLQAVTAALDLTLGDLQVQAQPVLNLPAGSVSGALTLRDPNAGRLISELGLPPESGLNDPPLWLGEGSLSLVAQFGASSAQRISLDNAELVAGQLRTRLQLALDLGQAEPRLTGSIVADTLPVPLPGNAPLPIALLRGWQAQLRLGAEHVLWQGTPVLDKAAGTLRLDADRLRLEQVSGSLAGGVLTGGLSLDAAQRPATVALRATLHGAAIDGPLAGWPIDLAAGQADLSLAVQADGYSADGLLASLSGTLQATVRDGALSGLDLDGLRHALRTGAGDAGVTAALAGGRTPFQHLTLKAAIANGIVSLDQAELSGDAGTVRASGSLALPNATADLRLVLHADLPSGPDIPLQVNGALSAPQRVPELAALVRWRTAHAAAP